VLARGFPRTNKTKVNKLYYGRRNARRSPTFYKRKKYCLWFLGVCSGLNRYRL
jgi:hypothetical protein